MKKLFTPIMVIVAILFAAIVFNYYSTQQMYMAAKDRYDKGEFTETLQIIDHAKYYPLFKTKINILQKDTKQHLEFQQNVSKTYGVSLKQAVDEYVTWVQSSISDKAKKAIQSQNLTSQYQEFSAMTKAANEHKNLNVSLIPIQDQLIQYLNNELLAISYAKDKNNSLADSYKQQAYQNIVNYQKEFKKLNKENKFNYKVPPLYY